MSLRSPLRLLEEGVGGPELAESTDNRVAPEPCNLAGGVVNYRLQRLGHEADGNGGWRRSKRPRGRAPPGPRRPGPRPPARGGQGPGEEDGGEDGDAEPGEKEDAEKGARGSGSVRRAFMAGESGIPTRLPRESSPPPAEAWRSWKGVARVLDTAGGTT